MSNREKPVRHNPGWLSDVSLRHYRMVSAYALLLHLFFGTSLWDPGDTIQISWPLCWKRNQGHHSAGKRRVIDLIHAASGCATVKLWLQFLHGFASKNGSSLSVSPLTTTGAPLFTPSPRQYISPSLNFRTTWKINFKKYKLRHISAWNFCNLAKHGNRVRIGCILWQNMSTSPIFDLMISAT